MGRHEQIDETIEQFLFWEAVTRNPDLYDGDFPDNDDWKDWESWPKDELDDEISLWAYQNMKFARMRFYELTGENLIQWDGKNHLIAGSVQS
ncbi:MAG: hypothetical protein VW443_02265 [Pseudomonadales bacterium]